MNHSAPSTALAAALAIIPLLACGVESPDSEFDDATENLEQDMPTSEELQVEAQYMQELFEEQSSDTRPHAMAIDLADDEQYRFLVHRLRAAGMSRLTAPELFERVDHARLVATNELTPRSVGAPACDMFITTDDAPEGTYGTIGRSSCVDGSDYSLLQVCHYDASGVLLDCTVEEEFGDGIDADVVTHTITDEGFADGVSYHLKGAGEEFYYYVSALTTTAANVRLFMAHPEDLTGDGTVQVCLERSTGSTDCDYKHSPSGTCSGNSLCNNVDQELFPVYNSSGGTGSGQYDNDRLYVPMQSDHTYLVPNGSTVNGARAWLTLRSTGDNTPAGGLCTAEFSSSPYLTISPYVGNFNQMKIDPFALDIGNAVWPDHCVDHRAEVDLHVEVNLQTGASQRIYAWNSATSFNGMSIAWGCLPPGTAITLADGIETAIETIEVGDRILADDDGGVLTVVDVMVGEEDQPLVMIEDSLGHELPMTITHPVPTLNRGVIEARELAIGDRLETEDGVAHVVGIDRKDYEGEVYNLVLGTPEELEARGGDTTMLANHVVVGDVRMQGALKAERTADDRQARAQTSVPPELYVDYLGSKVRGFIRGLED